MKTDLYTKAVLTVIAICLTVIALRDTDIMPKVHAATTNINSRYGLVPLNADGSIDVNIKSSSETMKVEIADINTSDKLNVNIADVNTSNKLNVSLKEVDCWAFSSCTIPVKIKQ